MRNFALLALALATAAGAQQRIISPAPDAVSVTIYRNPERTLDDQMDLNWLGGYALVTEIRTVDLPAGASEIRFEGVADTLIPASVIIGGLPRQPAEKNYDARLLSPGALVDANLGRQVHIRRTNRATGKVAESEAIIRSGPSGIVLQTAAGIEALSCTGLAETLAYDHAPDGLSDKPTLSIHASAEQPTHATVRLSYLATQFDWQANYVASLRADGRTLDLFAWLTLANGNDATFPSAQTQAVAGKPNRENGADEGGAEAVSPTINLQCWPAGTTSDVAEIPTVSAPPPPAPPAPERGEDIVVTGTRIRQEALMASVAVIAQQEELGDLKLYRIPEPVTVAANAQKQVALLAKEQVAYDSFYALSLGATDQQQEPRPVTVKIRMKNLKERGLGVPLPSGSVAVFESVKGRPMLVGEPPMPDAAVGEDVQLEVGESPEVIYTQQLVSAIAPEDNGDHPRVYRIDVTNARPAVAVIEVELRLYGDDRVTQANRKLTIKNGRKLWQAVVPANGRASLTYTVGRSAANAR